MLSGKFSRAALIRGPARSVIAYLARFSNCPLPWISNLSERPRVPARRVQGPAGPSLQRHRRIARCQLKRCAFQDLLGLLLGLLGVARVLLGDAGHNDEVTVRFFPVAL